MTIIGIWVTILKFELILILKLEVVRNEKLVHFVHCLIPNGSHVAKFWLLICPCPLPMTKVTLKTMSIDFLPSVLFCNRKEDKLEAFQHCGLILLSLSKVRLGCSSLPASSSSSSARTPSNNNHTRLLLRGQNFLQKLWFLFRIAELYSHHLMLVSSRK